MGEAVTVLELLLIFVAVSLSIRGLIGLIDDLVAWRKHRREGRW